MAKPSYRVAFLGAGYIADWHFKALKSVKGAKVVAVCDLNLVRASDFAHRYGIDRVETDLAKLLAVDPPDVVHVLLPPEHHFAAAKTIAEAGVHVLLEKPECTAAADAEALVEVAERTGKRVGTSHNFLFAPVYQSLRTDVHEGRFGPLSEVDIIWNKELGQIRGGPFGSWLLSDPAHVMLELGPHGLAHVFDLLQTTKLMDWEVSTGRRVDLPNGKPFLRRWEIHAESGSTRVTLRFGLEPGIQEHFIRVRGLFGSATCDFEAGAYTQSLSHALPDDFDRLARSRGVSRQLAKQARRKATRYALSKFKLVRQGNDFGLSIAKSLQAFYAGLAGEMPESFTPRFAADIVATAIDIGRLGTAHLPTPSPTELGAKSLLPPLPPPRILVLGGTGFIGQELVKQLVDAGESVRILARDPKHLPKKLQGVPVEAIRGDISSAADLDRAMQGIEVVYHLARANVKSWGDYQKFEIEATRQVAEACLRHGIKRLLYTGTIDSFDAGDSKKIIEDDTPLDERIERRNLYARAKAESEKLLEALRDEKGLPLAIFRPGIVIGAGGSPFHWGVGMWQGQGVVRLWGDGNNPLPLVLVEDVASALVSARNADGVLGKRFNLVGDATLTVREYIAELETAGKFRLNAKPRGIWRFYAGDLCKWVVKVLVRHPDRRMPSYGDWRSRTQRARFQSANAKSILHWHPVADRAKLVEAGIARPVEELLS